MRDDRLSVALRGAVGFIGGSIIPMLFLTHRNPVYFDLWIFISGAVGAIVVLYRRVPTGRVLTSALFFGIGTLTGVSIAFIIPSFSGAPLDTVQGAYYTIGGFTVGFAAMGAIGGIPLGWRCSGLGAVSFGVGGLLGGAAFSFCFICNHAPLLAQMFAIGACLPYVVGGALFAVFAAPDEKPASER